MKNYLITGGTGSWGNELTKQLLAKPDTGRITIFSRNEYNQVMMQRKFAMPDYRLHFVIGDVRDYEALYHACWHIDTVFHLAALKHVPICEEMPLEAIKTNITGTECLIRASIAQGVRKVIDVSTDKACSPNNLYGMTKAVGEKLILNANKLSSTEFVCIRAGNVLGSAGSVVPLFISQIQKNNYIQVTAMQMTRYFMSLPEAITLLLTAKDFSFYGDLFVMKMPSCEIGSLARVIASKYGNVDTIIAEVGVRAGEKMHEVLLNEHETPHAYCFDNHYYVVSPTKLELPKVSFTEYSSDGQELMTDKEILTMLEKGGF